MMPAEVKKRLVVGRPLFLAVFVPHVAGSLLRKEREKSEPEQSASVSSPGLLYTAFALQLVRVRLQDDLAEYEVGGLSQRVQDSIGSIGNAQHFVALNPHVDRVPKGTVNAA